MTHPFDAYFRRHQHYPRLEIVSGVQKIVVEFAPGYVSITSRPRGHTIYITRTAWFTLLRRGVALSRKWKTHPDHDVPRAMHESYEFERERLRELREQKKHRPVRMPRARR